MSRARARQVGQVLFILDYCQEMKATWTEVQEQMERNLRRLYFQDSNACVI